MEHTEYNIEDKLIKSIDEIVNLPKTEVIYILASLFFSPKEIACFLKLDVESFHQLIIYNKEHEFSKSYYAGQMKSLITARINEFNSAVEKRTCGESSLIKHYNKLKEAENE